MRRWLLELLGEGARLQSSYLPGRSGFLITTQRPLADLRLALMPRWACRLYPLHLESGRLFLEPTSRLLSGTLAQDTFASWWTPAHQTAAATFFSEVRRERVRRLPIAHPVRVAEPAGFTWSRGFRRLRSLALRLEALKVTPRPDKHWVGIAAAFDELWSGTALHAYPADPLARAVLDHLGRCREYYLLEDCARS